MDNKLLKIYWRRVGAILLTLILIGSLVGGVLAAPGEIIRVSVDSIGGQASNYSRHQVISDDGRYVAYESEAINLVSGDANGAGDVFIYDRQTGSTTRVSIDSTGIEGNAWSGAPAISGDGRYVAFYSDATNLVSDDTNGFGDIFVHDRQTGETTRVSVDSSGTQADGFSSDLYYATSISADGRYVAFQSEASNLVADDTNGLEDIFVHDRQTEETRRVSVDSSGTESNGSSSFPEISSDGNFVAFTSFGTNLVSGDTNGVRDVFVHALQSRATTRVSVNTSGVEADGGGSSPSISGDGRYVLFLSDSTNLAAGTEEYEHLVYLHDRQTGETTLESVYSDEEIMVGTLSEPSISGSGRYIAFSFYDRGNGLGLQEIWVRDLQITETVQATFGGTSSDDSSFRPTLSYDGGIAAFWSLSSTLVGGDSNGVADVFAYEVSIEPDLEPTVISILQDCPRGCVSAADPVVDFTVTFSESVTGVTLDDFVLSTTGGLTGTSLAEIIGSGSEYIVAVNTGSGEGTVRLDLIDDDSIVDGTSNPLGGAGAGNGDFNTGDVYSVDRSTPAVTGITRGDASPTSADNLGFSITFSEEVIGVDAGDFGLVTTGSISGVSIVGVSGSGTNYNVNVGIGGGEGTLRLDLLDNDSITDPVGNPLGGEGINNGNFNGGEEYSIDKTAPYVTTILRADPSPTTADSVTFTVGFTEAVFGVDVSDFSLTTTGSISGAAISAVNGSGSVYTVTAGTGSDSGTLRLDVNDDDSIIDALGNPLGGTGVGTGAYYNGEVYTIEEEQPIPENVKLIVENFRSNARNDGWVVESSENSNQGGGKNSRSRTIALGDTGSNSQIRGILHFPTQHLPNNAVITRVLLMIRGAGVVGTNPFETLQNIQVDIRSGAFGFIGPFRYRGLQNSDFESPASRDAVGIIENNPYNGWYWAYLDNSAFEFVNLYGITQIRLSFQIDDNNDNGNDYLRVYSGDHNKVNLRPRLLVEYYVRW